MLYENNVTKQIERLQVDFLAHSYLYYIKNISTIPDTFYDQNCKYLYSQMNTEKAKGTKYYNLCKGLDASGSGFYIKEEEYPDEIIKIAYKLQRQNEEKKEMSWEELEKELY